MSQSIRRAAEVLELVSTRARTQSEVADHLQVHRSTALRILHTLTDCGLTRRNADGTYSIGYRLAGLAAVASDQFDLPDVARAARRGHGRHLSRPRMEIMTDDFFDTAFADSPVMAILRGYDVDRTVELATRAWELGIGAVEVPIQNDEAVRALTACVQAGRRFGRAVGAGTVVTSTLVARAVDAGAAFTVAPGYDPVVARASTDAGLPHLPGVATATEVHRAIADGHRWVKAFPADALGIAWFRGMRGPFPNVRIVATGGVSAGNALDFLAAGADAVALGSALEDETQLDQISQLPSQQS